MSGRRRQRKPGERRAAKVGERGSATVELLGMMPLLLLAALAAWQLMLGAWAVTAASNAARTGSRVEGSGGNGEKAALASLSGALRDDAQASIEGEEARVEVEVPIVVPGLSRDGLTVTRTAELPAQ